MLHGMPCRRNGDSSLLVCTLWLSCEQSRCQRRRRRRRIVVRDNAVALHNTLSCDLTARRLRAAASCLAG